MVGEPAMYDASFQLPKAEAVSLVGLGLSIDAFGAAGRSFVSRPPPDRDPHLGDQIIAVNGESIIDGAAKRLPNSEHCHGERLIHAVEKIIDSAWPRSRPCCAFAEARGR